MLSLLVIILGMMLSLNSKQAVAQIYEPEGLNMPGGWNGWTNPPANALALASYTQVSGGRVTKITNGTTRWQTIFSVATSGGDLVGGTYEWLFTSGSTGSPWGNKWAGVAVSMNNLQTYTFNSGGNNTITIGDGKWYTMNWKDNGYNGTQAIFMETSALPVDILSVSVPVIATVGTPVIVTVTVSNTLCPEEILFVRYSTDNWATSNLLAATMTGTTGTVEIPAQADGTTVKCYAFTTTNGSINLEYDMHSIKVNNNGGANYSYPVGAAPISWANVQSPATALINPGETVDVFGQVYIAATTGQPTAAPGVQGWIGYSSSNTNPDTWVDWVPATYVGPSGLNDEYKAALGTGFAPGTYYYASRFKLNTAAYVYGGYNGGIWNGSTNISGILTVNGAPPAVTTGTASLVSTTYATVSGTVIGDGGSAVTERGICWSTLNNPTLDDDFTVDGSGTGSFSGLLTSLIPGTTYFARAYATNANGTSYGLEIEFKTLFSVVFNVDMSTAAGFIPGTDVVYLAGGFPGAFWNTPGSNPGMQLLQVGTTLVYTIELTLSEGIYEFKHFKNASWSFGEWGGGSNRSVNVTGNTVVNSIWGGELNWANLQSPASGIILPSTPFEVTAQASIPNGITGVVGGAYGLQCWIGYSTVASDPSTWTNWVPAPYFTAVGGNDEFKADIGSGITTNGIYYYASRFKLGDGAFVYGGYNSGFWNGTSNISGVLSVVNGFVFTVVTGTIDALSGTTASINGNVIADGGNPATTRGICWSTSASPTLEDDFTEDGSGLGAFTGSLTSLIPGTTYHARAYATNAIETVYGDEIIFSTYHSVILNLDMSTASGFIPGTDQVFVAGSFPGAFWNEPGTNLSLLLSPVSVGGLSYTIELFVPSGTYNYKFFLNPSWAGGEWASGPDRSTIITTSTTLNHTWAGELNWVNLQWPDMGTIEAGTGYDVYAMANIPNGRTGSALPAYGLQSWIGYSTENTDPSTWTNWVIGTYNAASGANDEFKTNLGAEITVPGVYYYASRFQLGAGNYVYGGYSGTSGGYWDGTSNISGILTVNPPATKTLNVKLFLEGLFDTGSGTMNQAMDVPPSPKYGTGIADILTIELHDAITYTSTYSFTADLFTDGTLSVNTIPGAFTDSYYLVIKHRNSLETWSASPISFSGSGPVSYDFSLDASQVFGNNMKLMGTTWVIFGGDASQDGIVDGTDMASIDNASTSVMIGYNAEDVNGDGVVDGSDMALIDNNSTAIVQVLKP